MNLHTLAEDLDTGRCALWQLPSWAFELWHSGYFARDSEIEALAQQLEQAELDADRYYELWRNPGRELTDLRRRRFEEALAASDDGEPLTLLRQVELAVAASRPAGRRAA